ncbi:MAG: winged helix-turn-helix domain-containing protein [Woeseiaceae bacterium]|nr:winged helix-turn-helix domain-containing protein [Woeseiaceae bacterium]
MALASILVVDADAQVRALMARELRELGHDVTESDTAGSALKLVRRQRPDLMVCDFSLPDLAGVELLSDVRSSEELRSIRVLITSSRGDSDDVIRALESGADDFIGKPVNLLELRARVDACLRRPANLGSADEITAGGIVIDNVGHRVSVDGTFVSLAPREYRLLLFLLSNQDRVFSRKQLLVHVWDRDATVGARTVDVHVRRLRGLLEPFGYDRYLQTVRGSGYRFSLDG